MPIEDKMVYEEDIIPTIFKDRRVKRLTTPERENSQKVSIHMFTVSAPCTSDEVCDSDHDIGWYVIEGEGEMIYDGEIHPFIPGTAVYIPKGCKYHLIATTNLKIYEVSKPPVRRSDWANRKDLVMLEPEDAVIKK